MSSNSIRTSLWAAALAVALFAPVAARPASDEGDRKASAKPRRIAVLGDSLATSAGRNSFPGVLGRRLAERGYAYEVVNAGRGGDMTAGGLRRIDEALAGNVSIVIVELGGNDGLRGVPIAEIRRNLTAIVSRAKATGATVLLAQMETPPTRGFEYSAAFHKLYEQIASEQQVALIPFILADVFQREELTYDGIHPNEAGAERIADVVWRSLEPVLDRT